MLLKFKKNYINIIDVAREFLEGPFDVRFLEALFLSFYDYDFIFFSY